MKNLLLIVNPCSGRGKMRTNLLSVTEVLSNAGFNVTVYPTKCSGDATVRTAKIKDGEFDRIVVCGGDGTLNEVITGIMQCGVDIKLGYIPAGTLNEWSSGLNISRNFKTAAADAAGDKEISLDIGKFGEKYFSYTASFGAFTEASYSAPQDVKNALGQVAYFFEGIKSLGNIKPIHLKFQTEEKTVEGDFLFGAVSNSMSVGGIVKFDQTVVKLNDGLFEIVLIRKPKNIVKLQGIIDAILKKSLDCEDIEFLHAKNVKVLGGDDVAWTLDGEYAPGDKKVIIENIPSAIRFIVPENKGD